MSKSLTEGHTRHPKVYYSLSIMIILKQTKEKEREKKTGQIEK